MAYKAHAVTTMQVPWLNDSLLYCVPDSCLAYQVYTYIMTSGGAL